MKEGYKIFHHIYDNACFLKVCNYENENKIVFFSYNSYHNIKASSSDIVIGCWIIKWKNKI